MILLCAGCGCPRTEHSLVGTYCAGKDVMSEGHLVSWCSCTGYQTCTPLRSVPDPKVPLTPEKRINRELVRWSIATAIMLIASLGAALALSAWIF
jgi:hypothetical protein